MTYIEIKWTGKATYGGYLSIDGEKPIFLDDTLLIPVEAGTHHLQFYGNKPNSPSTADSNAMIEIEEDEYIVFEIFSDANQNILTTPTFTTYELTNAKRASLDAKHKTQVEYLFNGRIEELKKTLNKKRFEFITCLLFGYMGAHKLFFQGGVKGFITAWVYLMTMGGFLIFWIRDTIIIGKEMGALGRYIQQLKNDFANSTIELNDLI